MNNTEYGKLLSLIEGAPDREKLARAQARVLLEMAWDLSRIASALEGKPPKEQGS
jgi:hypothetical protein